jgi:hypothetical protein
MNPKLIGIGIIVLLIFGMGVTIGIQTKKIKAQDNKIVRLADNIDQLLQENVTQTALILTQKEITGKVSLQRDSLANALKIRPKQVTKYIDRVITEVIRDTIEVKVVKQIDSTYFISDKDKCFTWEGIAIIERGDMEVKRLLFEYKNEIADVFFWKRKWFLAKKKYYQQTIQTCGESKTLEVSIIKR